MAPETLRSEVFPASDVWAAGVMAHQLLTGRFPFDDKSNPFSPSLSKVWGSILTDEVRQRGAQGGACGGCWRREQRILLLNMYARHTRLPCPAALRR